MSSSGVSCKICIDPWKDLFVPPVASAVSLPFIFAGLMAKSSRQLFLPPPNFFSTKVFVDIGKAIPTTFIGVGAQTGLSLLITGVFKHIVGEEPGAVFTVGSTFGVSFLVARPLVALNKQSQQIPWKECWSKISWKERVAISGREGAFMSLLKVMDRVDDLAKEKHGNTNLVFFGVPFALGFGGALLSHPCDTVSVLLSKDMKLRNFSHLYKGALLRATSIGFMFDIVKVVKIQLLGSSGTKSVSTSINL